MEKKILDPCCGGRMFYFDKQDPRVVFCDNREWSGKLCDGRHFEIRPDVLCDFTALPFEDNSFKLVVFDPPHLTRNTGKSKYATIYGTLRPPTGYQQIKYGSLETGWEEMLRTGFNECFRVLAPDGVLIFKWSEIDIPVSKVLALTDQKPIFGHRSGKRSKTHWVCFMKTQNGGGSGAMKAVPLSREDANAFVSERHLHHAPTVGDKYRVGVADGGKLVGVIQVGRPVSHHLDDGHTLEVTRLCTDGTRNACSFLYSRAARIAKELCYSKIITYILNTESGESLRASGWAKEADTRGGDWNVKSRPRSTSAPNCPKQRWSKTL